MNVFETTSDLGQTRSIAQVNKQSVRDAIVLQRIVVLDTTFI